MRGMQQQADTAALPKHASLVLVAGGLGRRMGSDTPKPFLELDGRAIILRSLDAFAACGWISERILVVPAHLHAHFQTDAARDPVWSPLADALRDAGVTSFVAGGERRQDSVLNGLNATNPASEVVLIHDAVRPFITREMIEAAACSALAHGAAIPAVPVNDTIKQIDASGQITQTLERSSLRAAQTPQAFQRKLLLDAFASHGERDVTDEAQLIEFAGGSVQIVAGSFDNIKITTPSDIPLANRILSAAQAR